MPIGTGANGIDLTTSVENEWLCSEILRAYGIAVAPCRIRTFGAQKVLVVQRFDRRLSSDGSWIVRIPQEDICQATGVPGDRKYEAEGGPGIKQIMDLLLGSARAEEDRHDFFRTQILFWMLCAIDGHAKNFSLFIESGGRYRLTPRYDVLSAFPVLGTSRNKLSPKKIKMAMAVEGSNRHYRWDEIHVRHWRDMAKRCGIASVFDAIVADLVAQTRSVVDTVRAKVPKDFPDAVADPILSGLIRSARRIAADSKME